MAVNMVPGGHSGQSHTLVHKPTLTDNVPNQVVMTLNQGSSVVSMDFHPVLQILLLGKPTFCFVIFCIMCLWFLLDYLLLSPHLKLEQASVIQQFGKFPPARI